MRIIRWLQMRFRSAAKPPPDYSAACRWFRQHSHSLLAQYQNAGMQAGKPRGLRWVSVEATGEPLFGIDSVEHELAAIWPVMVVFEPLPGSDLEDVPQATGPRPVLAVFRYRNGEWSTDGRTLFNMTLDAFQRTRFLERIVDPVA